MKSILQFFYYVSAFASGIGFFIGGALIHLWTIYITYENIGGFWAIISFFAPVISQLYWMYSFTVHFGFLNAYNVLIIALFVIKWGFAIVTTLTASGLEKIEEKKYNVNQ
ncbi:hypothetical protein P4555_11540 [Peribacillus frigoritolerans]|uniref:hypothetical protein n=1 Tax=Peribacillus frigoritolerans TaxID=450367 RepID=UPI002E1C6DF4|nr:hypothetical protein [Peribacillus frigoritolerans]